MPVTRRSREQLPRLRPARCEPGILRDAHPPAAKLPWIPEHVTALYRYTAWNLLSDAQRLAYNHYCALHMAEQFVWIEEYLIVRPARALLAHGATPPRCRAVLASLVSDEEHHEAVFRRLLQLARPELYAEADFRLFRVPATVRATAWLAARSPCMLASWVLAANFFEERSLIVHREYQAAGSAVDPVFAQVHAAHAQDEARHCQLDRMLADWLLDRRGRGATFINRLYLTRLIAAYHDPRWGFDAPIRALVRDDPALAGHLPRLIADAVRARGADHRRALFDPSAAPITARNRRRHDILDAAIRHLGG